MAERFYTSEQLSEHISRTPEGFLLCEGVPIARTGEMVYSPREAVLMPWLSNYVPDEDGLIHVHRRPEVVFDPEVLKSFEGKTLTVDHPDDGKLLHPDNWSTYTKGTIQNLRQGGDGADDLMLADVLVMSEDAIELVLAGLRQISAGYDSDFVQISPGHLDTVKIVGNHAALVDKGRAGARCAIQDQEVSDMSLKEKLKRLLTGKGVPATALVALDSITRDEEKELEKEEKESKDAEFVTKKDLEETLDSWWKKTKDCEMKAAKDAEDEEEAEKKKKKEEEDEKASKDKAAPEAIQDVIARSEILIPGHVHGFTADVRATDLITAKRGVLKKAYATEDGKKAIEKFTGANPSFDALPQATLDAAFIGASELIGQANNGKFARKKISTDDFGAAGSISAINKANREFWDKRKPTV